MVVCRVSYRLEESTITQKTSCEYFHVKVKRHKLQRTSAFNEINRTGQDRVVWSENRNGTGQDLPLPESFGTGRDIVSPMATGRDMVSPMATGWDMVSPMATGRDTTSYSAKSGLVMSRSNGIIMYCPVIYGMEKTPPSIDYGMGSRTPFGCLDYGVLCGLIRTERDKTRFIFIFLN